MAGLLIGTRMLRRGSGYSWVVIAMKLIVESILKKPIDAPFANPKSEGLQDLTLVFDRTIESLREAWISVSQAYAVISPAVPKGQD
jgi:hypothetical protein